MSEQKYKVEITVGGLPEDNEKFNKACCDIENLIEQEGYTAHVGIGEPDDE